MALSSLLNAVFYAVTGLVLFGIAVAVALRLVPGNLLNEAIRERSLAAAVVLGSFILALAWIIASAVH